jgi:hypothetical protein
LLAGFSIEELPDPHGPFHLVGDDVDDRLSRDTQKTRGLTVRWEREHEPTDRHRIDQRRSDHAFVDRGKRQDGPPMAVAHEVLERGVGVGLDRNVKCYLRI